MKLRMMVLGQICALAATASAARADLMWGVNGHPLASYPGTTTEQQLDFAKSAGLVSYRVDVPNSSRADALGTIIAQAKARGTQILPLLVQQGNFTNDSAQSIYQANYDFAYAIVRRFKADVRTWELGNEAENFAIIKPCETMDNGQVWSCQWGPGEGDAPLEYVGARWAKVSAALKGLSEGTTAADPTAKKAIGTAGWGHTAAFSRMQTDGVRWDISVWHWYGDEGNMNWAMPQLAGYGKPIRVTEFNHAGGSQSGEQQQADGLLSKIAYLRRVASQYNITAAHIYELMDETYWAPHFEAYMGLVHLVKNASGAWTAGTLKPAYNAVKSVLVAAPPATPPPTTPPPTGTVATGRSTLRAVNGGLCMDVQGNSYSAGAPLIQWSCNNSSNQTFIVTALDATRAQIKVASSNLCLRASALTSGSTLVQSGCSATDALQAFTLTPTGAATTFQIKISNGLCVGARNGATGAGPVQDVSDCNATRAFVASGLR